jgi:UDP-N-acetylglucosamine 2-epimerase (non-hydrolysing)
MDGNILCAVGARPNFMKISSVYSALRAGPLPIETSIVHTGQHYDESMKDTFFRQLGIPEPDVDLEVGSGPHGQQTGEIMLRFEPVLDRLRPAAVLVVGDVNSTIACALVAVKKGFPVIHVEAGLRSFDRSMPEEINRVLTDQISELLFTTEHSAKLNLLKEGIDENRIHFDGNDKIDTLKRHIEKAILPKTTLIRHAAAPDLFLNNN